MDKKEYIRAKTDILWSKLYDYRRYSVQHEYVMHELAEYDQKIKDMQRPKGISLEGEHIQNPKKQETMLNEIFSDQKDLEKEMYIIRARMAEIRTIIDLIEDDEVRLIAREKFIYYSSWKDLANEFNCDRSTLVYRIKKELSKFLHFSQCGKE